MTITSLAGSEFNANTHPHRNIKNGAVLHCNSGSRLDTSHLFILRSKKVCLGNWGVSDLCHLQGLKSYQVFWGENQLKLCGH